MKRIYIYSGYQRLWHWIQAVSILALIVTGLEIHLPDAVHLMGFKAAVQTHNFFAYLLIVNASAGLFYYLTTGEIRQLVPEVRGLLRSVLAQARYYAWGIFRHEPHPFEREPERRLNPLQRLVYLFLLNVLLPLQAVTGTMIAMAQLWLAPGHGWGSLGALAYAHSAGAWLFIAFLIGHLYLITTGTTPTANIKTMLTGWEPAGGPSSATEGEQ